MSKYPAKHPDLLQAVRKSIELGSYLDTTHVTQRKGERKILRTEIEYVLKNGHTVPSRDRFDETHQAWNYAIEGPTVDSRKLRVIVSFDEVTKLLIITVIDITKKGAGRGKKN
jgi:hypothetical protein